VPVLSVDCPHGPRDILQGGELGTLTPNQDVQSIADGIEQAMTPDPARDARTANAKESVLSRFGIGPATRALEELLALAARRVS
jgi:glycosyltransferase involved in cell wall biosynthesis